jgi:hypothetical protein
MGQASPMRFALRHFTEVFDVKNKQGAPLVLIGGQAVNYWAELYSSEETGLAKWQPFTSEDIDFQGRREDVRAIASQLGSTPIYPRAVEMTALVGMVPFKRGDFKSQIEIVSSVPGVPAKLLQEAALEANWEKHRIRVIDPISLLYAKAHLALKVPQKGRRDTDHLAIMVICVRAFLRETSHKVEDGSLPARNWLAAVERVLALSESTTGARTTRRFKTDWNEVLPLKEIERSAVRQVVTFRKNRLPRWRTKISSFVRGI